MTLTSVTPSESLAQRSKVQGLYQTVHQAELSNLQAETEVLLSQLQTLKQNKDDDSVGVDAVAHHH
jgi:ABC-type phosphate transport system auxiliary subunit